MTGEMSRLQEENKKTKRLREMWKCGFGYLSFLLLGDRQGLDGHCGTHYAPYKLSQSLSRV